jgi:hypothetical protein
LRHVWQEENPCILIILITASIEILVFYSGGLLLAESVGVEHYPNLMMETADNGKDDVNFHGHCSFTLEASAHFLRYI